MSKMPYETVVLPLAEAVDLETKQNMERDRRVLGDSEVRGQDEVYRQEAEYLLTDKGGGYIPDFPDHNLVKLQQDTTTNTQQGAA